MEKENEILQLLRIIQSDINSLRHDIDNLNFDMEAQFAESNLRHKMTHDRLERLDLKFRNYKQETIEAVIS